MAQLLKQAQQMQQQLVAAQEELAHARSPAPPAAAWSRRR